jgi:hypothetical protein
MTSVTDVVINNAAVAASGPAGAVLGRRGR